MEFIDSHSHLAMLKQSPTEEILKRARAEGVRRMVSVSVDEPSWIANQQVAESDPDIYFTLGIHPHEAKDYGDADEKIRTLIRNLKNPKKCVGIGEAGLDFYYNRSTREEQFEAFEKQLRLSNEVGLPLIIHCRDAFDELYAIIKKIGLGKQRGVMHCFTGNPTRASEAIDFGLMISFSGIVTFKNATDIQAAAVAIPVETILLETDCPFLAPVPHRGKPNEPCFIRHTAEKIASLRGCSLEDIATRTTQNACALFGI